MRPGSAVSTEGTIAFEGGVRIFFPLRKAPVPTPLGPCCFLGMAGVMPGGDEVC
jgi:hypothetical protein